MRYSKKTDRKLTKLDLEGETLCNLARMLPKRCLFPQMFGKKCWHSFQIWFEGFWHCSLGAYWSWLWLNCIVIIHFSLFSIFSDAVAYSCFILILALCFVIFPNCLRGYGMKHLSGWPTSVCVPCIWGRQFGIFFIFFLLNKKKRCQLVIVLVLQSASFRY